MPIWVIWHETLHTSLDKTNTTSRIESSVSDRRRPNFFKVVSRTCSVFVRKNWFLVTAAHIEKEFYMTPLKSFWRYKFTREVHVLVPSIIETALQYLDYCEYFSLLPHGEVKKLRAEEVSTKDAALHMLNEWKLGLFFINSDKTNGPPPIATIALRYLILTARGVASPMDNKGDEKIRELSKSEKDLWTTALSLLRNWFNHDIELT